MYITLNAIAETGNQAHYHAVDVMDRQALQDLGTSLGRPITGIVHGAGLEDSKLVADKGYDSLTVSFVSRLTVGSPCCQR